MRPSAGGSSVTFSGADAGSERSEAVAALMAAAGWASSELSDGASSWRTPALSRTPTLGRGSPSARYRTMCMSGCQRVEPLEFARAELEVEDVEVLRYPLPARRPRDHHEPVLNMPAQDDLGRCLAVRGRDVAQHRVIELTALQRAVALQDNVPVRQLGGLHLVVAEGVPRNLVQRWRLARGLGQLVDLRQAVVAHPDGARLALFKRLDEHVPHL